MLSEEEKNEVSAQTAEAEVREGAAETVQGFGKFKDAQALLKAYENLESEFTRRSQRLRALESERERGEAAEKTQVSAAERKKYGVEDFLRERPCAAEFSEALKGRVPEDGGKEDISREYENLLEERLSEWKSKLEDRDFFIEKLKSDGKAREEIVKEYLKNLYASKPETTFGGGMAVVAPPLKPKTLKEAGELAKEYIKLKGET